MYLVVDADLSPSQLVSIGAAQGLTALVFEVPAGVVADTIGRRWSLVASHALMGTSMIATGLVTDFPALLATQMLWGLSWTFASGADVAWITDELDDPPRIALVLVRSGRAQLTGAAAGIAGIGVLGAVTERSTAMISAGAAMLLLGGYVLARFRERRFVPAAARRISAAWTILRGGSLLVRRSRAILALFAATFLVNGATDAFGRLQARRLVDIGLPTDPVAWFTVLGVVTLLVGAAALRLVQRRVDLSAYGVACAAGALGAVGLAAAPDPATGSAAVLLVAGIAAPLSRTIATIWVNRQTTGEVRATVHSFLAQAEYAGEIVCGLGLAVLARAAGMSATLAACAALLVGALALGRLANR